MQNNKQVVDGEDGLTPERQGEMVNAWRDIERIMRRAFGHPPLDEPIEDKAQSPVTP